MTAFNITPIGHNHTVTLNWANVSSIIVEEDTGRTVLYMRDGTRYFTTEKKFDIENRINRTQQMRIIDMESNSRLSDLLTSIWRTLNKWRIN